jgi:glucose/mannose-6-phosphate isomerase
LKLKTIEKFDKKSMHIIYNKWPKIAKESYESKQKIIEFKKINHIVFSGMGGSGTLGDIFSAIFSCTNIQIDVIKGYNLPKTVSKNTLVISTSVSGNTIETISVLKDAIKKNCKIISFSSGGKIINMCNKNKIEYRIIPKSINPRTSLVEYLYSMLKVLQPILPITKKEVKDSIIELEKTMNNISSKNLHSNNLSLKLAKSMSKIPVVYFPDGLGAAAVRFKNSLEENSKMHIIIEDVIEVCHNGIVSWENYSKDIRPILIQGKNDNKKTKKHWLVLKEFFATKKIKYEEVNSIDGNILSKIINLIYLLDYATIYRAIINQKDPSPVISIDFIKKRV